MVTSTDCLPGIDSLDALLRDNTVPHTAFRSTVNNANACLKQAFENGRPAAELVSQRVTFIDSLLARAWQHFVPAHDDIALVAVGGYGRKELHPGSDIDLAILVTKQSEAQHKEAIAAFLTFLWDIGLEVGHSVRTLDECLHEASRDITVATNLMESHLLCGSDELYTRMLKLTGPGNIWNSRDFFAAKWKEQKQRHHKYHDTSYNLEPNIKEGPGGMRDIHMIGWVAKRHFGANTLHDLVAHGFLSEQEYEALMSCQDFLWKIRMGLHTIAGRREDRLLFDYQRTLAKQFGYTDSEHQLAVEIFMKKYYRTVMELNRLNEMLLQLFQEAILYADETTLPAPINNRFQSIKGFVEVVNNNVFKRYPFALLEIFLILEQYPELKGVRASTIRLIREHRHLVDDSFRKDIRCRSLFMEIMRQPKGITHELRRMNRYGVLAAYIPMFEHITGQMQHDLFHVYTVDEHSLFVLRNVRRLTVPEFSHELPVCSNLIKHIPKLEILYLAALFHDIAKGRGGDHSELGAIDALNFCLHHGMSSYDANYVAWLVRHHLVMSVTTQREDISDPEVIKTFAAKVENKTRLDYLYLLTVSDIRGTNPSLWNSWKDALLMELYSSTRAALEHGLDKPVEHQEYIDATRKLATEHLIEHGLRQADIDKVWQHLGKDYFMIYSADEITWHTRTILEIDTTAQQACTAIRSESEHGGTQIFCYQPVNPLLFAVITQALDRLGLNIVDARIMTSANEYTFDTFVVLEEDGTTITDPRRLQEIKQRIDGVLAHPHIEEGSGNRHMPRQLRHFQIPTNVAFSSDIRMQRTHMDIVTSDRPGLLGTIARALLDCGVNIRNARIATFGERVEDSFVLVGDDDQPVHDTATLKCLEKRIIELLDGLAPPNAA